MMKKIQSILLALVLALSLTACSEEVTTTIVNEVVDVVAQEVAKSLTEGSSGEASNSAQQTAPESEADGSEAELLPEDGSYTTAEDVALYLDTYGHLPDNFMTKKEARALGWEKGSLEPYAPGMCIGGDHFGNYEGLLPEKEGREYTECDIDTLGANARGAKRIVFSNDGLIYYTEDHYESFTLMYGEEAP